MKAVAILSRLLTRLQQCRKQNIEPTDDLPFKQILGELNQAEIDACIEALVDPDLPQGLKIP